MVEVSNLPKYVVIEFDILNNEKLSNTEKILYGFITVLASNSPKGCFASTKYLCDLMKLKPRQLKNCLANLKKFNYITCRIVKNKRYIVPTINQFLDHREKTNEQQQQLFDYDWLNDSDE